MAEQEKKERKCGTTVGGRCERPARMAIAVTRPRGGLVSRVYYDVDEAPAKTSTAYCKEHGERTLAALVRDLVQED